MHVAVGTQRLCWLMLLWSSVPGDSVNGKWAGMMAFLQQRGRHGMVGSSVAGTHAVAAAAASAATPGQPDRVLQVLPACMKGTADVLLRVLCAAWLLWVLT